MSGPGSPGSQDFEDSTDPKGANSTGLVDCSGSKDSLDYSGYLDWLVLNWTELPG